MLTPRVSPEERELVKQAARAAEMSVNEWVRVRIGLPKKATADDMACPLYRELMDADTADASDTEPASKLDVLDT